MYSSYTIRNAKTVIELNSPVFTQQTLYETMCKARLNYEIETQEVSKFTFILISPLGHFNIKLNNII